jgi:iron-sulfur cluster assembly accessory protein
VKNSKNVANLIAKTDKISLQFIEGAKIDFVEELGAGYFKVINPNATANCGCGSYFAV